jgi:molybdenum cofactor cytidylyltransferase
MKFGPVPLSAAEGCILAHSVKQADGVLKKGHRLTRGDLARLADAGIDSVVVATLGPDDVHEDEAARRLAEALAGTQVDLGVAMTGRMNLFARGAGLVRIDAARIHAVNAVHESLTVATLAPWEPVTEGQMLATVKVIPYAAPRVALDHVLRLAAGAAPAIDVAPWRRLGVGLVMTRLPDTRGAVLAKMRSAVEKRLLPMQGQLVAETEVAHAAADVAAAIVQIAGRPGVDAILVSGIAATVDRADVVPTGIELAGGHVLHAGMPVDPGNLLLLGSLQRAGLRCPVVGLPTCARSPKLNGFDFVLRRLAAGIDVGAADLMALGVGGLLGEIPNRPSPRE